MSVTNYENITCKYTIGKLDKMVYFVPESAIGSISLDGSVDYVYSASTNQALECYALTLSEGDTLDERYEFTHSLNFSVKGYMSKDDIIYKHVIVKDKEGTYWLLNPMFPCKLTYTFTLDATSNHTDFVVATKSNYPMLRVQNFNPTNTRSCSGYDYCGFDYLELNDTRYSKIDDEAVYYTNDGFKVVKYLKNTATFTETYDGNNVSHELKFNINFSDYKSSWHYTLLEFQNNKYAAVISTKCGNNIACGFGYGLQPSFTVSASDTQFNNIEIKLSDLHDQGHLMWMPDDVPYSHTTGTTWMFIQDEFECINSTQAKHLLMQEYDFFGNPMGNYKCLEGYEEKYTDYNIVGTYPYSSDIMFDCKYCKPLECKIETSIPQVITFTESGGCKAYSIKCDSSFTLSASSNDISVFPISGEANTYYSVSICNYAEPTTSGTLNYTITANYCEDKSKAFNVEVAAPSPTSCLPQGQYYSISTQGQNVTIPTSCCVTSADSNDVNAHSFQVQNGYVTFRANANQTGSERTFTITLTMCNGSTVMVYVTQSSFYSRWVFEERTCYGQSMCDFERMYSGETSTDINTPTYMTRWTNCSASTECATQNSRWVETTYTGCSEGHLYIIEQMQISYDGGQTWSNTGQMRYGREIEDVSGQCAINIEHWVVVQGEYLCNDTTKYFKERLYLEEYYGQPQENWLATDSYRRGDVDEYDSEDCGGGGTGYTYTEWRTEGTMCNGYNKYIRLRQYGSNDTVTWVALDIYMQGSVIEEYSEDCGYVPEYEYRWVSASTTTCVGYDLYQNYQKQQRRAGDTAATWSDVVPTTYSYDGDGTMTPILVEEDSSQCGYVPPIEPQYRWVSLDPSIDFYCDGTSKYYKQKRQISVDSGVTWSDVTPLIYNRGNLIEVYSTDCGYIPYVTEYRWVVVSGEYECSGTTKMTKEKKQQSTDGGSTWTDVVPSETRAALPVIETESTDCGYIPPIEPQYRTISGTPYCNVYDKYVDVYDQVSYDSGTTWTTTATSSVLIEAYSEDCGYVPPTFEGKWKATYAGGTTSSAACDSTSAITQNEITLSNLVAVEIGDCVTSINDRAFDHYTSLTRVTIPNSVTSIGQRAFSNCYSLTSIKIPSGVTSINDWTFYCCSGLTSVVMPSGVTSIGNAVFYQCASLASVTIPDSVTSIGVNAFGTCSGLTSVTIGSGVTSIGNYAFDHCSSLTSVTIPNSVTSIGHDGFWGCTSLTSITIGSGITSIGYSAFQYCSGLTSITINATTPPTLGNDSVFVLTNDCPIYVPCESVEAYKTAWSTYASRIQCVQPPAFEGKWKATYIGGTTSSAECDSTSAISRNEVALTNLIALEIGNCVTSIGEETFMDCRSLTSVTIPDSVTSIGIGAFDTCSGITSIAIPSGVTSIGEGTFGDCRSLTSVTIPDSVTSIGDSAFIRCSGLTSVTLPSGITMIDDYAFYDCNGLTAITIYAVTPPTLGFAPLAGCPIYVPAASVNRYKNAFGWSTYASRIQAIP